MWWKISLALSIWFVSGCSKDDNGTPAPTPPAQTTAGPTTQQLIAGPRTALNLKFAPITLEVPPGWELKASNDASLVTIDGQTPTSMVRILVPLYRTITVDQESNLESHARKDSADHPDLLEKPGVRDIAGGKVIERLILDPPIATTDLAALPTSRPVQTLQWTFTLCVPSADGKQFNAYDLKFLGMTLQQYKADQTFLRSVMDSLAYTPSPDVLTK